MDYKSEKRICQNCKKDFIIEPEDFNFYEKIKVPPPTFCPECRTVRRMIWRNMRSLFKRECGLCGKSLISMYSDLAPVYCSDCWYGNKWDPFFYGRNYDFTKPFFLQLKELFDTTPRLYNFIYGNMVNSDFVNFATNNRNVYLAYSVVNCEDIMYSENIDDSKNSLDSFGVVKLDGCSYNIDCESNYNSHYLVQSNSCIDSYFLYDCVNCSNCCLSYNLRNKQYFFKNQQLSKEEYKNKLKELKLETYSGLEKAKGEFNNIIQKNAIHKYALIYASQNSTGDYIHNSKNIKYSFNITHGSENIAYGSRNLGGKDHYDVQGGNRAEFCYESVAPSINTYKIIGGYLNIQGCRECEYSLILKNCSNCFGCVGLTNAKYCILNKQYEEKEYFEMVEKTKQHMNDMPYIDVKNRIFKYGEFFPPELSPFAYNESITQQYFSTTKEKALESGYNWYDDKDRNYKITKMPNDLPDDIKKVEDTIISEVIGCEHQGKCNQQCTTAFKVTENELIFYRKMNIPLPSLCQNCRHYERLAKRNPMRLWHRICMCDKSNHEHKGNCQNEFETAYAPDRQEIVYCERCYQQEVY